MTEFWIQFVAEGDGAPEEIRLRRMLKDILRSHGLRCLAFGTVPESKRKSRRRHKERKAGEPGRIGE